jgi:hypothetical protein
MNQYEQSLGGGDLRSMGNSNKVSKSVHTQKDFDELMELLDHTDRKIVMRAADVIEKVTQRYKAYLKPRAKKILSLLSAEHIELKWHVALLVGRIDLPYHSLGLIWNKLSESALDKTESKIVRVNAIQTLSGLCNSHREYNGLLQSLISAVSQENIPSINARIKKLKRICDPWWPAIYTPINCKI